MFEKECAFIWRLQIPFENLTTSVFLIETEQGYLLFDCACGDADVDGYILPALRELGVPFSSIRWLFCSHSHADHAGGTERILKCLPNVQTEADLPDCLQAIPLPGHTLDCRGLMDMRTRTLLSGDGLQFCGIGRFGCGLHSVCAYRKTLRRIHQEAPLTILASHDYVPFGNRADGVQQVNRWIEHCKEYTDEIAAHVHKCLARGIGNSSEITDLFRAAHLDLPPVHEVTIQSVMREEKSEK